MLADVWREHWAPRDRRPSWQWAADYIELPPALTVRGKFDATRSRHFIAPMEAFDDDAVEEVSIRAPVRSGKSLIADVLLIAKLVRDPGPTMYTQQTDDVARETAKSRLRPMFRMCEPLAQLLPKGYDDETTEIIFSNGIPLYIQGAGLSNLQSKGIRYLFNDEVWMWRPGRLAEVYGRVGDYRKMRLAKILNISQGGDVGDEFDLRWKLGTQEEWTVPCDGCGKHFEPRWTHHRADGTIAGMRWDQSFRDSSGLWNPRAAETAFYECPFCGYKHVDSPALKQRWNAAGQYQVTAGDSAQPSYHAIRSYHWNAIIDSPWSALVESWLNAVNAMRSGNVFPIIAFVQKQLAEVKSEEVVSQLRQFKRETIDVSTQDGHLFLTVDRQDEDTFWVVVWKWLADVKGKSALHYFGKLYSFAEIEELRIKLGIPTRHVGIDSGYRPKGDQGVYAACVRYGWIACKGTNRDFFVHRHNGRAVQRSYAPLTQGDPESGAGPRRKCAPLILFASNTIADRLDGLIDKGMHVLPARDTDDPILAEYTRQMSAEWKRKKVDKLSGRVTFERVCPSGNNHAYDCAKMQVLFATLAGLLADLET